jgi:ABC-type multidrug transport system ATPase subunit
MLGMAMVRGCDTLLLDEPTANLDSRGAAQLCESLNDIRSSGCTILLATADILLASQAADRVGILKHGQIVAERTRDELLAQSLSELYLDVASRPSLFGNS